MKRIYSLDFLKLFFAYIIAFYHFGWELSPGPVITVQIFFIVSGFFLGKKFYAKSHADCGETYGPWQYTLDHAKSIYPIYLFSVLAFFCFLFARSALYFVLEPTLEKFSAMALDIYNQIPDLLFLQSAYRFHESFNYPLWQVSALLIAGFFVYGLLCQNEKLSRNLLFPAAILMIQCLLYYGQADLWGSWGPFYVPLLRAFSPLCIGVLTYVFTTTPYYGTLKRHKTAFNLATLYGLAAIFAYGDRANIFLLSAALLVLNCWDETSWLNKLLNRSIFRHCGKLSLSIYVNHALIARILEARLYHSTMAPWMKNTLYFAAVTAWSVLALVIVETLRKRKESFPSGVKGFSA